MKIEEDRPEIGGVQVHRYRFRPEGEVKGGVIMTHGLGDYLGRYDHVARMFCERGLECVGVDLPGHGRSPGQRGHLANFEVISDLLDHSLFEFTAKLPETAPIGLFAHSMGGYAALEYLPRRQQLLRFAWINSPLVRPTAKQHPLVVAVARRLGWLIPRTPFGSGISAEQCRPDGDSAERDPLLHAGLTIGFGTELILQEEVVQQRARELDGDLSLLITHGTADEVCCPSLSRALFEAIPLRDKQFIEVEDALHEPLHGPMADWTIERAGEWLDRIL